MGVKMAFKSTLSTGWLSRTDKRMDSIALRMATDVDRFAKVLAPKDSGNLVNSGMIEKLGAAAYKVAFGGSGTPTVKYAKRRHYENKKNPHTLDYLKRAGNAVARNKAKYISGESPVYK